MSVLKTCFLASGCITASWVGALENLTACSSSLVFSAPELSVQHCRYRLLFPHGSPCPPLLWLEPHQTPSALFQRSCCPCCCLEQRSHAQKISGCWLALLKLCHHHFHLQHFQDQPLFCMRHRVQVWPNMLQPTWHDARSSHF